MHDGFNYKPEVLDSPADNFKSEKKRKFDDSLEDSNPNKKQKTSPDVAAKTKVIGRRPGFPKLLILTG